MSRSPQAGKRIVSKSEYLWAHGKRISLVCLGIASFLIALGYGLPLLEELSKSEQVSPANVVLLSGVSALGLLYFMKGIRIVVSKRIAAIDPGVPLTRANTADLPAPDSLVRASEPPIQEQQTVLLRAASVTRDKHEEQLVRAVGEAE